MTHEKLRIARTDRDVLVSNLRGEIGAAITTWLLLRHFMGQAAAMRSKDPRQDIGNRELSVLDILVDKLRDDLIAELVELGDEKIGRTNFYFTAKKLQRHADDAERFSRFVVAKQLRRKRNAEIAHREQPEEWFEERPIRIRYRTIIQGLGMAVRLMKKIDRVALGPAAPFLWLEARKKRRDLELVAPARAMYLLLPHFRLSEAVRVRVVLLEQAEGKVVWAEMATRVNGEAATVLANREWGVLMLGNRCMALPEYPLQRLDSIDFSPTQTEASRESAV